MSDMTSKKPFVIAKRSVWEAYQQVKANRGAAGIDEETIAMFEQNLSRNLYKLWNRMSSGSYFPPPVKQVEIPKAKGGTRKLGIAFFLAVLRGRWSRDDRRIDNGAGADANALALQIVIYRVEYLAA